MLFWTYTKHLYLIIKFCTHTHTKKLHFTENVSAKHTVHIIQSIQITALLLHSKDCKIARSNVRFRRIHRLNI